MAPMTRPRFSIIVPTRNHPGTLRETLRTCVAQTFEDLEIVVSDNCGEPETRQVVEELADSRIKYGRSDVPLAMAANWELGLSRATGEYTLILGDDDGLPFYALREADELIRELGVEVLRARSAFYTWPSLSNPTIPASMLTLPTLSTPRVKATRPLLGLVTQSLQGAINMPSVYNSFIHRSIPERIRASNGRVFNGSSPDWYSAFAIAASTERYGEAGAPLHIIALSGLSNGNEVQKGVGGSPNADFFQLSSDQGYPWHADAPRILNSFSAITAECLAQARQHAPHARFRTAPKPRDLVRAIMSDLNKTWFPIPPDRWAEYVDILERYCDRLGLKEWFSATYDVDPTKVPEWSARPMEWGPFQERSTLDMSKFGVSNVYEAAEFMDKLLRPRGDRVVRVTSPSLASQWLATTKEVIKEAVPPVIGETWRRCRSSLIDLREALKHPVDLDVGTWPAVQKKKGTS